MLKWSAEPLRDNRVVIRPVNEKGEQMLGTCGWHEGKPWQAVFCARSRAPKLLQQLNTYEKDPHETH